MNTIKKSALFSGISILVMAVIAGYTFGYIHSNLVIQNDPAGTLQNLRTMGSLFKREITGWVAILILDIIASLSLYFYFRDVNKNMSFMSAIFRLVYSSFLGIAIFKLVKISGYISNTPGASIESMSHEVMMNLAAFEKFWSIGLIVFGFHLIMLGILALQSRYVPQIWGILLLLAAVIYISIHSLKQTTVSYEEQLATMENVLSLPMALGEVGFAFWLVIKGGKNRVKH